MESRRGKGMHDKKERAALLLKRSSKFPLSALASLKTQEPKRFFSPPAAQGLSPFFFCPDIGAYQRQAAHEEPGWALGSGLGEPVRARRSESFPVYPSASLLVWQHIRMTTDAVLPLGHDGG